MLSVCEQRRTAKVTPKWRKRARSCFTPLFCVSSRHQAAEQRSILSVCEQRRTAKVTQKWRKRASKKRGFKRSLTPFVNSIVSIVSYYFTMISPSVAPASPAALHSSVSMCISGAHGLILITTSSKIRDLSSLSILT